MTLQECKDKIAQSYGYDDWNTITHFNSEKYVLNEVAELYAQEAKREGKQEGWDEGLQAMKDVINDEYVYREPQNPYAKP